MLRTNAATSPFQAFPPRSTLPEEIASRLLSLIREQKLRPGDKLPPERDLALQLGVSRPVLREALRALSIMRVVDIRQGAGTYITSLEPEQLISHLDFVFAKDNVALIKLFEARRVVELGNVRFAAERISDAGLARLADLLDLLRTRIDQPDAFSEADIAFHDAICEATDNFLLAQFMTIIDTLGKVSRERTGGRREMRTTTLADHRRILQALRSRDPALAEHAMREHLDHVEAALRSAMAGAENRKRLAPAAPATGMVR